MKDTLSRSGSVKKNILYSLLLKAVSVCLSFLLLPLTICYLKEVEYGIWVTLFSVMNWVNMLDMGIGFGLRNKLAEAVSVNDKTKIKGYISTSIFTMLCAGTVMMVVFVVGIQYISFQSVFNTTAIKEVYLYKYTLWTGIFVIASFVLSIINQFYYAYQKAAVTGIISLLHNCIMLLIVYFLTLQPDHDLLYFIFSFGIATICSKLVFFIKFYYNNLELLPSFSYVNKRYFNDITTLGFQFFIVQITALIMFSTSNIIITQKLGPEAVRTYDVLFKIFSIITMVHGIVCTPLWSAYTDAWIKKDYIWLKRAIKKMVYLMGPIAVGTALIYIFLPNIIDIWIRTDIEYDSVLAVAMSGFIIISCWNNIWAYFLNGVGLVALQIWTGGLAAISVVPLSWFLMDYLDSAGMIVAMDVCLLCCGIPQMIQVLKLIKINII